MISSSQSSTSSPSRARSPSSEATLRDVAAGSRASASSLGRFVVPTIVTPLSTISLPGCVSSQLPPVSAARSTITEPGRIARTASAVISLGAGRPGNRRGRDHGVEVGDARLQLDLLRLLLLGRQLARVAALGLLAADAEVEERRAERLTCSRTAGRTSKPETTRAEAARGRDRLQPGDARAEHEHLRRRDRPGGGHQHRQEAGEAVGGDQRAPCSRRPSPATRARPSTARA